MKSEEPILRVGLIGADGRLGKAILALKAPDFLFTPLTRSSPATSTDPVDLYLDVSNVMALEANLHAALQSKKPIVIGTTGHTTFAPLKEASRFIPLFYSPNFSLGMALLEQAVKKLAQKFHREATIKIIESHHEKKKDAPSGSALNLAKAIEESYPAKTEIESIRFGEIIGKHECIFENPEECFTLIHEAKSRSAFAKGALLAVRFLANQSPGFYTMSDLTNS